MDEVVELTWKEVEEALKRMWKGRAPEVYEFTEIAAAGEMESESASGNALSHERSCSFLSLLHGSNTRCNRSGVNLFLVSLSQAVLELVQSNLAPHLCHRQRCNNSVATLFLYTPEIFWSSRTKHNSVSNIVDVRGTRPVATRLLFPALCVSSLARIAAITDCH
uniref:Uncharacterized protein n=1 Tax=Timema tahoe TaxID=61484 RepID=A0A7R9FGZ1_9NEOP|nr:unnamed protein product [Timema tahoe]